MTQIHGDQQLFCVFVKKAVIVRLPQRAKTSAANVQEWKRSTTHAQILATRGRKRF
jgi:hypothetical protein